MRTYIRNLLIRVRNAAATTAVAFLALPAVALAVAPDVGLTFVSSSGLTTTDIRTLVARIISYFLMLLGLIAVALVLYAGFMWMTAGGNEEKVSTAKRTLTQAVIGLVIIVSSYAITAFIINAISGGGGGTSNIAANGCAPGQTSCCPPGQICAINLGGGGGFRVSGITPAGAGPSNGGWPKNYAFTAEFNAAVSEASVTAATVEVSRCNERVDGSGTPLAYRGSACGSPVAGTLTVEGARVLFRPSGTAGDFPSDFEANFWYRIRLAGGGITDVAGRALACPFQTADISSPEAGASYCERAASFNDIRDTQPPTIALNAPFSPPAYCPSPTSNTAQIVAVATDDFLVAGVDFLLDGGTEHLQDQQGLATASSVNGDMAQPFNATSVNVNLSSLAPGSHTIRAVARDGVPQSSDAMERTFAVVPGSCCNGTRDAGETGNDCGGSCGSCSGESCTTSSDCSSGACVEGKCAEVPNIKSLSTYAAGPGSMVTIDGAGFGTTAGSVTFLGTDTDGNGDAAGDADDVSAQACAPQAWSNTRVVVAVPSNAVGGPVRLTASAGSDRTDDDVRPPKLPNFAVTTTVVPGICYLSPSVGSPGTTIEINGAGFGQSIDTGSGQSSVTLGTFNATVTTCDGGASACGWSDSRVYVVAPPIPESEYPVTISVGTSGSNPSNYLLQNSASTGNPIVTGVIPENAPVGSYVTITGSNFGSRRGIVRFANGTDVAIGADPVCDDNWTNNAIVVKVPPRYQGGLDLVSSAAGTDHGITVETASPSKVSTGDVKLGINNDLPRPGVCSISPNNGPAGTVVEIKGEGFGSRDPRLAGPASSPLYTVNFFDKVAASLYSQWTDALIGTVVAGQLDDATTWPKTGPVTVVANNQQSANAVPFTVQDCKAAGAAACGAGTQCCANGSCLSSCAPVARDSAYGWQFSTSVLPSLPQVVERALCSASPAQMQSPSPAHDSQDACVNAQIFFEFNRALDRNSFNGTTVLVEECGAGDAANCDSPVVVPMASFGPTNFSACDSLNGSSCRMFQAHPSAGYNSGLFKKQVWYRVTLVSDPARAAGIREVGGDGKYLDGDRDKKQGGNYVTFFRARNSDTACELSNVQVIPGAQLISQDETAVGFNAGLLAGNCNLLQCGAGQPYSIAWRMTPQYLMGVSTANAGCTQNVRAVAETASGLPTQLNVSVSPTPATAAAPKEANSDVTIKFAEPRVVAERPKAECGIACINAQIGATFNVPMDSRTLNAGNVQILRCRNASCTAPFMPDLGSGVVSTISAEPVEAPMNGSNVPTARKVTVQLSGNMQPATFYMVRIRGGADGVKSRSGVALAGLNDGQFYSWKFRTNESNTACSVTRTTLEPITGTLRYVGDRSGLNASAFGAADECSPEGQELDSAAYNWLWSFEAPNRVLQGFVNGAPALQPPERRSTVGTVVDTQPAAKNGCTSNCVLTGSQDTKPQCGDGRVDARFETCDDGNANDGDACRNNCLLTGTTAASCGNGVIGPGEECERIGTEWPQGCKQPGVRVDGFADNVGCIFTGSATATNSTCGDGFVGDGEACDDGGRSDGDGCSSSCLREGSLRSCLGAAPGAACMNFCGNGSVEPGEDAACEPNPSAANCNLHSCIKRGTDACSGSNVNCCGNGVTDRGEDAGCEGSGGVASHCTNHCLLAGSSAFYAQPSFCGDGLVGLGEVAACESTGGDLKTDSYQAVVANVQSGFDSAPGATNMSRVRASVQGVPAERVGTANLTLNCTCKNEPVGTQDAYCQNINPSSAGGSGPFTDDLACADSGCCIARPSVVRAEPTAFDACRNSQITIVFSETMRAGTIQDNLLVGYSNGTAACPEGTTEVGPLAFGEDVSIWRRIWTSVASFVRNAILRPVFGVSSTATGFDRERYCSVPGTITVRDDGAGENRRTVATFSPTRSFPANKYVRIRLNGGVLSSLGTPLSSSESGSDAGYKAYFATGNDICAISTVGVSPATVLLSSADDQQVISARALAANGQAIVPTVDYSWTWAWDLPASSAPYVLTPRLINSNSCGLGARCTDAAGCPCFQGGTQPLCTVANGADTCVSRVPAVQPYADVRVRGGNPLDGAYTAKNSNGALPINARAVLTTGSVSSQETTETASVTVMLCRNPWPAYRPCVGNNCTADVWSPFHDTFSNVEFYYCRDQGTPDASGATASALPCLKETPATVAAPTAGILQEYLFTYETSVANCPNGPTEIGAWQGDALGMRVGSNPTHGSIQQWYLDRGFRGAPTPEVIDGYEALREGRTTYVNAASKTRTSSGSNRLYTNAYVLSHSEGSQVETTAIYNQILANIDFNGNNELRDVGVCRVSASRSGAQVMCTTDADCRVGANGQPVPGRETFTCDPTKVRCMDGDRVATEAGQPVSCSADVDCLMTAEGVSLGRPDATTCDVPKSKIRRDVKRWSDLMSMRDRLMTSKQGTGSYPTLEAGTFLRSQTNSTWPSWLQAFGATIGAMPMDPLNKHGVCDSTSTDYDPVTCWDATARLYMCPTESHVYDYKSNGGVDFALRSDFEYDVTGVRWGGSTCPELTTTACAADASCGRFCTANSAKSGQACASNGDCGQGGTCGCNFREGKLLVGASISPLSGASCSGVPQSLATGGACGDGQKNLGEVCEIGERTSGACGGDPASTSVQPQICNSTCSAFVNVGVCSASSPRANAECTSNGDCGSGGTCGFSCIGSVCGDGKVQSPEKCDDGTLNGTFGHCAVGCGGIGMACGDGKRQPNEACDCGALNGQYVFDGITSPVIDLTAPGALRCGIPSNRTQANSTGVYTCSWDCSSAGPRCGDNIVNGTTEECDGGFEEFRGFCNDALQTGCDTSAQCPAIGTCRADSSGRKYCSNGNGVSCNTDSDCVAQCGSFCPTVEQKRRRSCGSNNPTNSNDYAQACKWSAWSCTSPGTCGNGRTETGEQCDDGNTNNNDSCVIDPAKPLLCKTAVCGDGYINAGGGEECDDGRRNGTACTPEYGITCNYCNSLCRVVTVSGPFCGDGFIQASSTVPQGPEMCDGVTPLSDDISIGLSNYRVCVSDKPEHQSFGYITGVAGCANNSCSFTCADPNSSVCLIYGSPNSDGGNGAWNACGNATDNGSGPTRAFQHCVNLFNQETDNFRTIQRAVNVTFMPPLVDKNPIGERQGDGFPLFRDICDPDNDDDGVPDVNDCSPDDPNTHGSHDIPLDPPIRIPAAPEYCGPNGGGDGIDNDCNGLTDNIFAVTGYVKDGQTGDGIPGAHVQMLCAGTVLAETDTDDSGKYTVSVFDDPQLAVCDKKVTVLVSSSGYCIDQATQGVNIDFGTKGKCTVVTADDTVITLEPPPGTYTAVLTWLRATNLESHMRIIHQGAAGGGASCSKFEDRVGDSSLKGRHVRACAGPRTCIASNGAYSASAQACSRNSDCSTNLCGCQAVDEGYGILDTDSVAFGPETTTIRVRPSAAYNYYIGGVSNSTALGAKVHLWGNQCEHHFYDATKAEVISGSWWRPFNIRTDSAGNVTIAGGDRHDCAAGTEGCNNTDDTPEANGVLAPDAGPWPNCPAP